MSRDQCIEILSNSRRLGFTVGDPRGHLACGLGKLGVRTLHIERGSPWKNGCVENLNGKLHDDLLNHEIFCTVKAANVVIESWRRHYKTLRPHSSLGCRPPAPEEITAGPTCAFLRSDQQQPVASTLRYNVEWQSGEGYQGLIDEIRR